MTAFGIIWLLVSLVSVFKGKKWAVTALFVASTFQASSFINLGEKGISLFIMTEIVIILRYTPAIISSIYINGVSKPSAYLLMFIVYSSLISFVSPLLFDQTTIIDNEHSALSGGTGASLGFSTFVYIASLLLNFLTMVSLSSRGNELQRDSILNIISLSAVIVSIFGFIEMYMKITGTYELLRDLVFNNAGYKQALFADPSGRFRLQGGFSEPSYCGAFIGAAFWLAFMKGKIKSAVVIAIALALNFSGTGIIAFAFGAGLFCLSRISNKKAAVSTLIVMIISILLLVYSGVITTVIDNIANYLSSKAHSDSGNVRLAEAKIMLDSIASTCGIGIGLGVTRGGGFALNLLAATGIAGAISFLALILSVMKKCLREEKFYMLVLIAAMTVSIPDLSYPVLWSSLITLSLLPRRGKNLLYSRGELIGNKNQSQVDCKKQPSNNVS